MGEPGPGFGLAAEALARARLVEDVRQDMFDRHRPLQPSVPGAPDLSHAAGGEPLDEAVRPYRFGRCVLLPAHGGYGGAWGIESSPSCFIRRRIPASETCIIAAISRGRPPQRSPASAISSPLRSIALRVLGKVSRRK